MVHSPTRRSQFLATGLLLAATASLPGCAASSSRHGGAADASPQEPTRKVTLTVFRFWEIPIDAAGTMHEPLRLDGVELCAVLARPRDGSFEDFVPDRHCAVPSADGTKLVIEGVPALSEVVLEATLDGYRPATFAVATGPGDDDMTGGIAFDAHQMNLIRTEAWSQLTAGADVSRGSLISAAVSFAVIDGGGLDKYFPGGVTMVARRVGADGAASAPATPVYFRGGRLDPLATTTTAGGFGSIDDYAFVSFTDLPEGDYDLDVTLPSGGDGGALSACTPTFGYPSTALNRVRTPILAGASAAAVVVCE